MTEFNGELFSSADNAAGQAGLWKTDAHSSWPSFLAVDNWEYLLLARRAEDHVFTSHKPIAAVWAKFGGV